MSADGKRKSASRTTMKTMKEDLFKWVCRRQAANDFLDRAVLREKALELTRKFQIKGVKCSEMWLTNFLKDHGFPKDISSNCSPVFEDYRDWIDLMRSTIVRYKHRDLFHAHEFAMFPDAFPPRMEDHPQGDPVRNRITILMCCNSTGATKLPLLVSGTYPSRISANEHVYCHGEDSITRNDVFRNWMSMVNDRMRQCSRKILLLLPREKAHALKGLALSNVEVVYFPENFPMPLQPLCRDVFHYVKMIFRQRYAEHVKQQSPEEWNLQRIFESVIDAWDKVPREVVVYSFQRTRFRTDDYIVQMDCDCWQSLNTGIPFRKFVTFDDGLVDSPRSSSEQRGYNLRVNYKEVIEVDEESSSSKEDEEEERLKMEASVEHSDQINRMKFQREIMDRADYARKLIASMYEFNEKARVASDRTEGTNREGKEASSSIDQCKSELEGGKQKSIDAPSTSTSDKINIPRNINEDNDDNQGPIRQFNDEHDLASERLKSVSKKRRRANDANDDDEPTIKKSTTDRYWTKQFENNFVFGSSSSSGSAARFRRSLRDEGTNSCRHSDRSQRKKSKNRDARNSVFSIGPSDSPSD